MLGKITVNEKERVATNAKRIKFQKFLSLHVAALGQMGPEIEKLIHDSKSVSEVHKAITAYLETRTGPEQKENFLSSWESVKAKGIGQSMRTTDSADVESALHNLLDVMDSGEHGSAQSAIGENWKSFQTDKFEAFLDLLSHLPVFSDLKEKFNASKYMADPKDGGWTAETVRITLQSVIAPRFRAKKTSMLAMMEDGSDSVRDSPYKERERKKGERAAAASAAAASGPPATRQSGNSHPKASQKKSDTTSSTASCPAHVLIGYSGSVTKMHAEDPAAHCRLNPHRHNYDLQFAKSQWERNNKQKAFPADYSTGRSSIGNPAHPIWASSSDRVKIPPAPKSTVPAKRSNQAAAAEPIIPPLPLGRARSRLRKA